MRKLFKCLTENLSETAVNLIYYGCSLSFGLLIIGILAYNINAEFWGENYQNSVLSIKIITSSMSLFVQSFFFALIYDCVRLSVK